MLKTHTTVLNLSLVAVLIVLTGCSDKEHQVTIFEDVTASSGLQQYVGMTHGAAWGNFDNDALPDLYVTNHLKGANLYRNLGDGKFEDVTAVAFKDQITSDDKHGAAWADFNNDGRQDLVQLTGAGRGTGAEPKRLYKNIGGQLQDVASDAGADNPYGRTRIPLWYDFNQDGQLDLFQGAESRFDDKEPPFVFMQNNGKFSANTNAVPFASRSPVFCIATALGTEYKPSLACRVSGHNTTSQVFDLSSLPAKDLALLPSTSFEDLAAADFDNDGQMDMFLARKNPPRTIAFGTPSANELIADINIPKRDAEQVIGFSFSAKTPFEVEIASAWPRNTLTRERIFLGSNAVNPPDFKFTINDDTGGITTPPKGTAPSLTISRTSGNQWEIRTTATTGEQPRPQQTQVKIKAPTAIKLIDTLGSTPSDETAPNRLFMYRDGKFNEESEKRGTNNRIVAGSNVVAADFDNDMDVDLFILASGTIGNQQNLMLLNRGDGHFDIVANAGGAVGNSVGVGDSVTSADFDNDGFIDILTANGGSMGRSLGLPSDNGDYRLYRNIGNKNNWLKIDLEGKQSNRNGIGAVVLVTTGDTTQIRVQDGGVHNNGQNHQQLHFGLANQTAIEKVEVRWPSGAIQTLNNERANQTLAIQEIVVK